MAEIMARLSTLLKGLKIKRGSCDEVLKAVDRKAESEMWLPAETERARADVRSIFDEVEREQRRAAEFMSSNRGLERINELLAGLGRPPAPSKNQARLALKGVFINIYDLIDGLFDMQHESCNALSKYTKRNKLYFPRQQAKAEGLRYFLHVLH